MKTISLFVLLLGITLGATAQRNKAGEDKVSGINKDAAAKWISFFNMQSVSHPQNKIVQLSLDNMFCFVPDVAAVIEIPTLKTDVINQFMPNPYFNYNRPAVNSNPLLPDTFLSLVK